MFVKPAEGGGRPGDPPDQLVEADTVPEPDHLQRVRKSKRKAKKKTEIDLLQLEDYSPGMFLDTFRISSSLTFLFFISFFSETLISFNLLSIFLLSPLIGKGISGMPNEDLNCPMSFIRFAFGVSIAYANFLYV